MIEPEVKEGLVPDGLTRLLWFLVLAPPLAWAAHLFAGYALHATACDESSRLLLWITSIVLILLPAWTGWRGFTLWQSWPDPYAGGGAGWPEEQEPRVRGRERFMALAGFVFSCLAALLILGQSVPMILLRPCD